MRCRPCLCPYVPITETHISIVARMLSNLPSQVRQEIEFIRPMVEERFAKMEEFGEDWDKPVCEFIITGISLITLWNRRMICSCGSWARQREWRGLLKGWHDDCSPSTLRLSIQLLRQVIPHYSLWCNPDHCNHRLSPKRCIVSSLILNISNHSAKRSRLWLQKKAGRKPEWIRCTR